MANNHKRETMSTKALTKKIKTQREELFHAEMALGGRYTAEIRKYLMQTLAEVEADERELRRREQEAAV